MSVLKTSDVAEFFDVHTTTVRKWVAAGRLKPSRVTPGGQYRFSDTAVLALAEEAENAKEAS